MVEYTEHAKSAKPTARDKNITDACTCFEKNNRLDNRDIRGD